MGTTTTPPQATTPPANPQPSGGGSLDSIIGRLEQLQRQKTTALEPQREQFQKQATTDQAKIDKQFDELSADKKTLETPPPAPPQSDPLQGFASAAGILGMIASAFTKTPALAAMNAAAAAIKAHQQGDQAGWERQHQVWKEQTDLAYRRNELESQELQSALTKMTTDVTVGQAMIKQVAAKYDDPSLLLMNEAGLELKAAEVQQARDRAATAMRMHLDELDERMRHDRATESSGNATIDDDTAQLAAEALVKGDKSVLTNFGRGKQGAANVAKIREHWAKLAKQLHLSGADLAAADAAFQGATAALRTAGTAGARIDIGAQELQVALPQARELSQKVWRSGFKPLAKIQQAIQGNTNDPDLLEFAQQNQAVINAYAATMSRGGASTVEAAKRASDLLSTQTSQEAYDRQLDRLNKEVQQMQYGTTAAKQQILDEISGRHTTVPQPTLTGVPGSVGAAPPVPASLIGRQLQWSPTHHLFRDKQTGAIYDSNGNPVH